MATEQKVCSITRIAGADLSAAQYLFVEQSTAGTITVCNGAGEYALGVLQNDPTSGQAGTVAVSGVTKVVAGGTVAIGAKVTTTAAGKALTATTGQQILGEAMSGGDADEVISVLLRSSGAAA
jgi:hypothetical protein